MNLYTVKIASESELNADLIKILNNHAHNMEKALEIAKAIQNLPENVRNSLGMTFHSNPSYGLRDIRDMAEGKDLKRNDFMKELNKSGWHDFSRFVSPDLCSIAQKKLSDSTIWAKEIPTFDKLAVIEQLNKIADLQKTASSAQHLIKEIEEITGETIQLDSFKAKNISMSQIARLNAIIAQMQMHTVHIQSKPHYKALSEQDIEKDLNEAKANYTTFKNEILEVKFYKNGNILVKSSFADTVQSFT